MEFDYIKLDKDKPVLTAEILALYEELDKKLKLHGADVKIVFGYDEDALGSYTPGSWEKGECFRFSLPFIAFSSPAQLNKEDRIDLYKHEYAHYMAHNMDIPKEYQWQAGVHGSAWKYCCSLIGAVPSPIYKAGESRKKHDYDKLIEKKKENFEVFKVVDQVRREQGSKQEQRAVVKYRIGEEIKHPKFGMGMITDIKQSAGAVQLTVDFGGKTGTRTIDQNWLIRSGYKALSDKK